VKFEPSTTSVVNWMKSPAASPDSMALRERRTLLTDGW
jgi:hypothetical protein